MHLPAALPQQLWLPRFEDLNHRAFGQSCSHVRCIYVCLALPQRQRMSAAGKPQDSLIAADELEGQQACQQFVLSSDQLIGLHARRLS